MPVAKGGSIDPAATRSKVLAAAARLFYERGVNGVGVNEIAARAEASKLSIYRYFQSKENLVESMLAAHSDRIHDWLRRSTASAAEGPDRVLAIFDLLMGWFAERDYRGCTVLNTVIDTRGDQDGVRAIAREHLKRYRDLLEERLAEAGVAEPAPVARQLLLLIEGVTMVTTIDGDNSAGADARAAALALIEAAARKDRKARRRPAR
ncbi:MAG TPA: TetR/AcrR family transcriptional regulator [Pseudonocardiaceae bacterium]|nr:TetR/AcrR family transcriptional regulator [Pseudonocardiaceae bacterium]